jgi:hypothetical protein
VAISILSLFILIAKLVGMIMKVYHPILGVFLMGCMVALYAVSAYGQAGPDYADARYPSPVAWYIRMGCDIATEFNSVGYCHMAKASFAMTIYQM